MRPSYEEDDIPVSRTLRFVGVGFGFATGLLLLTEPVFLTDPAIFGVEVFTVGILRAMQEGMIHQHKRQHRLGDRRRADADARVVAAVGLHRHRIPQLVDRCGAAHGCSRSA